MGEAPADFKAEYRKETWACSSRASSAAYVPTLEDKFAFLQPAPAGFFEFVVLILACLARQKMPLPLTFGPEEN